MPYLEMDKSKIFSRNFFELQASDVAALKKLAEAFLIHEFIEVHHTDLDAARAIVPRR